MGVCSKIFTSYVWASLYLLYHFPSDHIMVMQVDEKLKWHILQSYKFKACSQSGSKPNQYGNHPADKPIYNISHWVKNLKHAEYSMLWTACKYYMLQQSKLWIQTCTLNPSCCRSTSQSICSILCSWFDLILIWVWLGNGMIQQQQHSLFGFPSMHVFVSLPV